MAAAHKCGPEHEVDFFNELRRVFERFPEAARTYAVRCKDHERDIMGIDSSKQMGVARIEGNKVITEYSAADDPKTLGASIICCEWEWHVLEHKWTCNVRWSS